MLRGYAGGHFDQMDGHAGGIMVDGIDCVQYEQSKTPALAGSIDDRSSRQNIATGAVAEHMDTTNT